MLFKELTELEFVTGAPVGELITPAHIHTSWVEWTGSDCGGGIMIFYKRASFTEGRLWLLSLPGGSSISVMGECGGLCMCQSMLIT